MVRRLAVGSAILWIVMSSTVAASETAAPRPELKDLPEWRGSAVRPATDWLLDETPFKAGVFRGAGPNELVLANGLIARTFRLAPNAATVGLDNLVTGEAILRGVKPEAIVEIDGQRYEVGGLKGQPNYAFLRPEWLDELRANPAAFRFVGFEVGKPTERLAWKRVRHHAPGVKWPPDGVSLRLDFALPDGRNIRVSVHYELYDGLPCYSKWLTVANGTDKPLRVDRFSSEILAAVERMSEVDELTAGKMPPPIHVETDMAFGGMMAAGANRRSFRWLPDPDFHTQVNYEKKTPCLLEVGPELGPAQEVKPGETFESFRAWVLPFDSTDRERQGLAVRRMYRTIAPWATENPLMMHCRFADERDGDGRHRPVRRGRLRDGDPHVRQRLQSGEPAAGDAGRGPEVRRLRPQQGRRDRQLFAAGLAVRRRRERRGDAAGAEPHVRPLAVPGQRVGREVLPPPVRFPSRQRLHAAGARRLVSGRRVPERPASGPSRPGRFAVDAVADDLRLLQVVPRPGHLSERAGPLFPGRLEQDRHGLPRGELVAAARAAGDPHAAEHLRRHVGEDAEHGLDVRAADRVPRRRCGGDHRAAGRASGPLRADADGESGARRASLLSRPAAVRHRPDPGDGQAVGGLVQGAPRDPGERPDPRPPRRCPRPGLDAARQSAS